MPREQCIYLGNKMHSHVEVVGTCSLVLSSGFIFNLEKTFYVPSFSRNLISVSRAVPLGYSFSFYQTSLSLFYKSNLVGNGTLSDGLFSINLQNDTTNNTMHVHTGKKRCVMNENSSMLWHRRLRHFSIQRIKRLEMMEYSVLYFLLILTLMWTELKENRATSLRRVSRGAQTYQKSYIQIFVVQTWMRMVQNTSSPSQMITHDTCISTCFIPSKRRLRKVQRTLPFNVLPLFKDFPSPSLLQAYTEHGVVM